MSSICLYFQVHQPIRLKNYSSDKIGGDRRYFSAGEKNDLNRAIFERVCRKCYLPTNKLLLKLIKQYPDFRVSFSFSGTALEQIEKFSLAALRSFQRLYRTGKVEILSETYYHSLAFFYSLKEFERQVELHRRKVKKLFGARPKIFRNTELAYTNKLGQWAESRGYDGILTEGWEEYLGENSPNFLYQPKGTKKIKLLLRNYRFSDDIAFRFSERRWPDWPLNAAKFANWLADPKNQGDTVNLFMDYETFGEHQWKETGIFHFLENLPKQILKKTSLSFKTAGETVESYQSKGELNIPKILTWADSERDLSAWLGNRWQRQSVKGVYRLENQVRRTKNRRLIEDWSKLQTSDHFYYMSTKQFDDGGIHAYFNAFSSPQKAYRTFMNVIADFQQRLKSNR